MIEKANNKIMGKATNETDEQDVSPVTKTFKCLYFYPDHNLSITASSKAEADAKLQELINKK